MVKICAIKSCPSGRKLKTATTQSPSFFRPTTPARLENWKRSLRIPLKSTDFICHLHFKEEHIKMYDKLYINGEWKIIPTERKNLKDEAVPTIEHQFVPIPEEEFQASIIHVHKSPESCHMQQQLEQINAEHHELIEDQESPHDLINYCEIKYDSEDPLLTEHEETSQNQQPIEIFKNKIRLFSMLPPFWMYWENPNGLEFVRMDPKTKRIKNHIRLNSDLTVTIIYPNDEELPLNEKINSYDDTYDYLKSVERWPLCVGTKFEGNMFSRACKGVIIGGDIYKRNQQYPRCKPCRILRNRLQNRSSTSTILEKRRQRNGASNLVKQC